MIRVGLCLGRSSPGDGGLFEFCSQLVQRVAAAAPAWRDRHGVQFHVRCVPALAGRFGREVEHVPLADEAPAAGAPFALWHTLHQLNRTPPAAAAHRLVTVHDLNYLHVKNAFSRWRDGRRIRALLAVHDEVAAVSHHSADDVRRHLGWPHPVRVIHNGARSFVGAPQRPIPGVDATRPFLLHLSRLSASKNPRAILALADAWPQMAFVCCGPPGGDAEALARANRRPNVQFAIGIDDAQKAFAYAHCTAFLFPSLAEGFGLPPIEAMHFGKPVLLARRTSLPEVGGDVAAYWPDDFDAAAARAVLEAEIDAFAADPARAEATRRHAARFDWDHAARAYLELYAERLRLQSQAAPLR